MQRNRVGHIPYARFAMSALLTVEVTFFAALWILAAPSPAYAYVDPSVMTYTIQALAGVAVALSAVAGVVFRRVRRKLFKALNIDENANKAVEGKIAKIDPDSPNAAAEFAEADDRAKKLREESARDIEKRGLARLTWPKRFAYALLTTLFAFFIILIAPALEIFGANSDSLVFKVGDIWWVTIVINVALAIAAAFALSALKDKAFTRALLFTFCLALAAYVQSFFMNAGMQPADGGFIDWTEWFFVSKMIISGIVWLAIIILPQILCREHRYVWLKATSCVAVAIMVMQGVGVASVFLGNSGNSDESIPEEFTRTYVTQKDLYKVHSKNNVIVFVLDTFDTKLLEELREGDSKILKHFTDFTYFRNNAGFMVPTQNALPYMLTGEGPKPGESLETYRAEKYKRGKLIPTIFDQGYSIDVYTDTAMLDYTKEADRNVANMINNIEVLKAPPISVWETYLALDQCALYRESPWLLKPLFWYYTTDVNNRMIDGSSRSSGNEELYELDDAGILSTLREDGLSLSDEGDESAVGAFKLIHLFGPHFPFNVDEHGKHVDVGKSDQPRQAKGSLKVVEQYLEELKRLGLYDSATIIVTADHGIWDERYDPVRFSMSPLLLVKPSMPNGGTGHKCIVSDVPVSQTDFAPTIVAAIGGDPSQIGSGLSVWDVKDNNRTRYFDVLTSGGEGGRRIVEYEIDGDVVDLDSWSKTGNEWPGA